MNKNHIVKPGLYRNRLNVELTVTEEPFTGGLGGGDIAYAVRRDEFFGDTTYLVTAYSLQAAGYEHVTTRLGLDK